MTLLKPADPFLLVHAHALGEGNYVFLFQSLMSRIGGDEGSSGYHY